MPSRKKRSFVQRSPLAYIVVPLILAGITALCLGVFGYQFLSPYRTMLSWFFNNTTASQPQDLMDQADILMNGGTIPADNTAGTIPFSSITYPATGDRYAEISISGTNVNAPVYYGDNNKILNQGVGTYKDSSGVGIPGEGKTILLAGHNNTFFNDLQHAEEGATVTITTHYGEYTYEITETKVLDYQDASAYDFTRTDENLILYTCYPFDAMGFTPDRFLCLCTLCLRSCAG